VFGVFRGSKNRSPPGHDLQSAAHNQETAPDLSGKLCDDNLNGSDNNGGAFDNQ
jgi:hypothetical protein